ncbi:hypothetical protein B0H14DRAFT_2364670 [Mycena olivaceomarginata]|nr:hypothetical protein B0H14DRAFT_2364670 [Mycena olivaceomarginata]
MEIPARMAKSFNKPIYACFKPAEVKYDGRGRRYLNFTCDGKGCRNEIKRYLDTQDKSSTGALRKHVKKCWGPDVLDSLDEAADVGVAREKICKPYKLNGTITAVFERIGQEKVTYSHRQLTRTQTNNRPFSIVKDRGFRKLMKTGRPTQYIPDPSTVSRDVRRVFARVRGRIAKLLQDYRGKLSFTTDAWTSPNHRAFIAICVHLEWKGEPLSLLLDLVEVPKVRR